MKYITVYLRETTVTQGSPLLSLRAITGTASSYDEIPQADQSSTLNKACPQPTDITFFESRLCTNTGEFKDAVLTLLNEAEHRDFRAVFGLPFSEIFNLVNIKADFDDIWENLRYLNDLGRVSVTQASHASHERLYNVVYQQGNAWNGLLQNVIVRGSLLNIFKERHAFRDMIIHVLIDAGLKDFLVNELASLEARAMYYQRQVDKYTESITRMEESIAQINTSIRNAKGLRAREQAELDGVNLAIKAQGAKG
jgi:vacuolar-type H+-ATPase subunit I/STV1